MNITELRKYDEVVVRERNTVEIAEIKRINEDGTVLIRTRLGHIRAVSPACITKRL